MIHVETLKITRCYFDSKCFTPFSLDTVRERSVKRMKINRNVNFH